MKEFLNVVHNGDSAARTAGQGHVDGTFALHADRVGARAAVHDVGDVAQVNHATPIVPERIVAKSCGVGIIESST